jgi:predicted AAA+ superfamily ATPase
MLTGMAETTMDDESFFKKDISLREMILRSWFREGSLGFIFGRRGAGKTWFAWNMAISISKRVAYGLLGCEMPRKTLYVNG